MLTLYPTLLHLCPIFTGRGFNVMELPSNSEELQTLGARLQTNDYV